MKNGDYATREKNSFVYLFEEGVFEEESARVAIRSASVRISGLVERLSKHFAAEGHSAADEDARQLAELDVGQAVAAKGERSSVAERDVARCSHLR